MYSEHFQRLWSAYRVSRRNYEHHKWCADGNYADMKKAEGELVEAMLDAGANDPVPIDGFKLYLSANRECSVTKENTEEVMIWLDEQRGGKDTFMRLQLDPWAVKRLVREELKDGADPSSYPSFLKVAVRPRLNVKGWIGGDGKEGGDEEQ